LARQIKRLYRSNSNYIIAGVCGGIAEFINWDPNLVRLIYVIISLLSAAFPGILIYLIAWFLVPKEF